MPALLAKTWPATHGLVVALVTPPSFEKFPVFQGQNASQWANKFDQPGVASVPHCHSPLPITVAGWMEFVWNHVTIWRSIAGVLVNSGGEACALVAYMPKTINTGLPL